VILKPNRFKGSQNHWRLTIIGKNFEVIRLATDRDWLHKATKEISKGWRQKRERNQFFRPLLNVTERQAA
jgi:hypothetical protein